MEINTDLMYQVVIIIFGFLTVYFASGLLKARRISDRVIVFLKDTAKTLELIGKATEDNQLTQEELTEIYVQAQESLNSARALIEEIKQLAKFLTTFTKK